MSLNRLDLLQSSRLIAWVAANKESILSRKLTKQQVADEATPSLGFTVTMANVSMVIDKLKIDWPRPGNPNGLAAYNATRTPSTPANTALLDAIKELTEAIRANTTAHLDSATTPTSNPEA